MGTLQAARLHWLADQLRHERMSERAHRGMRRDDVCEGALMHAQRDASRVQALAQTRAHLVVGKRDEGAGRRRRIGTHQIVGAYRHRRWAAIYSSPLGRAVTTAQPLADAVGLSVQTRDGFAEIDYGAWDGLSAKEVAERFPIEYARWTADPAWNPPTEGETAVALAQRVTRELEAIEHTHHQGGNVLIVAHKATIRVAICALLGVDVGRFRYRFDCPVGSVTVIEFREHGPFAFAIADRSHLSAELRALEGT